MKNCFSCNKQLPKAKHYLKWEFHNVEEMLKFNAEKERNLPMELFFCSINHMNSTVKKYELVG